MRSVIPAALLVAVLAGAGCTAAVASDPYYSPDLVYVSPGVQVIADYHEPIFYSSGLYWRYYGNTWYRSRYYTGGWVHAAPPPAVLRIDRPYGYARYRPQGWAAQPRGYGAATPAQRAGGGWRGPPPAQARPAEPMRRPPAYQSAPPSSGWRSGPGPAPRSSPAPRGGGAARPSGPGGGGWR
jgi:hypothetical protein